MIEIAKYGPWALIAGGSEGVGEELAVQLSEAGFSLVLLARKPEPLEATAERARANGVEVRTLSVDLTEPDVLDKIRTVTDDLEIGLLMYNAGANTYGHEFVSGDLDRFQKVIDLNITTQLKLIQHFGAKMKERRRGGIVMFGGTISFLGTAQISIYAAAKSFCRTFAEGLWLEMREYDVDVLEMVLGVTRTPAMDRAGLNMKLPGLLVSDPVDVAAEALANIGNGPVHITKGNEAVVEKRSGHNRAELLLASQGASKAMLPPEDE